MKRIAKTAATRAAMLALLVAGYGPPVRANSGYFPNQPSNGGDTAMAEIDFNATSIPTAASGVLAGRKYWILNLATYDGHNACFDISTQGDTFDDTRIYVYDGTINDYRSLNDDFAGTVQSNARVWIEPPSSGGRYVSPVITGYSTSNNSMTFGISVKKLASSTTESGCTAGATYKAKASGNTFVNAS